MKIKKLIACIVTVMILMSMQIFSLGASAADGTAITTAAELAAVDKNGTYYLANDILITGEWTSPVDFAGTLDGKGKSIVFSGARIYGGLFNTLKGATIKNLNLVDGSGDGHKANEWNTSYESYAVYGTECIFVAPLADVGHGIIENVVTKVDLTGATLVKGDNAGGIIGAQYGGNLTFKRCINMTDVDSKFFGGGMVSTAISSSSSLYDLTISECINYANIFGSDSAGGMIGGNTHRKDAVDTCRNILIEKCVNYGEITNADEYHGGGMAGVLTQKLNGSITVKDCINFGDVDNLGTGNGGNSKGQYGGIVGRIVTKIGSISTTTSVSLTNNLNYGPLSSDESAAHLAGILAQCNYDSTNYKQSNNYTVPFKTGTALPEAIIDWKINANDTLTTATKVADISFDSNIFVDTDDGIGLKWMQDAGLSNTEPTLPAVDVDYSAVLALDELPEDEDFDYDEDEGETKETETAPPAETEATEEKKGCGSAIGSAVSAIAVFGLAAALVGKKKKSND